ncbi:MAG: DNA/RNA nuclease SfsA, partial [Clostridia bacterium]|nr:DNA/RNA nuclease SfsA [Clostridia bacterium]
MKYENVIAAKFLSRPNRFIAHVEIDGRAEVAHVKNTGRCRELLVAGATVYLAVSDNPERKTKYDLIAVEKAREGKPPLMINMDSQIPNGVACEWARSCGLFSPEAKIRREVTYGRSRFDLYVEDGARRAFIEVKGVTLERDGVALFPDAPTERGVKHVDELAACI